MRRAVCTATSARHEKGRAEAELIQAVWVNHDHDLVDVHLAPASNSSSAATPVSLRTSDTSGHGRIIGDDATTTVRLATPSTTTNAAAGGETIHTTANHPWLTADRGWVQAGDLRAGEPVVTLYGATGTVALVHVVPGQADMYNLTVAIDHTYAVGAGQWVVHNCNGRDPDLQAKAKNLFNDLKNAGGDVNHVTLGVGRREDGALFVSLNERWAQAGAQNLTDVTAAILREKVLQSPTWADEGLQYVGPTDLQPSTIPLDSLLHAEDFLMAQMDQGPLTGLETWSRPGPCPRCVQNMRAAGLGHLLLPQR